ncbi:alpha/beta hydrolase family protein [Haloarchaeobius salinus]|uniref:alpha/beta hydrolase family protein n=1 Tax=Haloarchaeobius salinus TaxID=1198298 RepID=UPI00210EBD92|nr:alpha/beta hydrolase [Haloarchaeobius salinus]
MTDTSAAAGTARTFARRFLDGEFDPATDLLTEDGHEAVVESFPEAFREPETDAADAFEAYWWGLHGQYGEARGVREVTVDGDEAAVELSFEAGSETAHVGVEADGITDLRFDPEYEVPGYVDEEAVTERDVTVDVDDVALDARLAVPDGDGPVPGVVLVHGAGIHDPDGTAGASKILKDLAWGLASEGVATLRYEKRLAEHEVPDAEFTLDRVVVDDAVVAVDTLADADAVREDAVFVAGHSQGGMAAPRIAERHGGVAGVVNLDGSPDPGLDPAHADIIRYEFDVHGELTDEQEAQVAEDRETLRRIQAGEFDDDETIMGRPGVWHRSLNAYDPSGTASALGVPVFVANTFRVDEAVQPELAAFIRDRYETWRHADLPDGSRVAMYEGLDHYFQAGFAPTNPLSLEFGGNVAADVVADLADWLHDHGSRR